jgi:hypothetical protein
MKKYRHRRRQELLDRHGGKCVECGNDDPDILQVDHVFNDGAFERAQFPNRDEYTMHLIRYADSGRYKLLCANCNTKKEVIRRKSVCAQVALAKSS